MAYQFLHIDTVARSVPKKAQSKRWGLSDTLAEAARLDGACPHIDAPKPPKRVYGVPMSVVGAAVEKRAGEARDAKGRKLRKDAPVLLAGVVSYPISMANLDCEHWAEYERWERKTLDWLAARFGDGLASVVRHTDETFPHLHFFIVPQLGVSGGLDLEAIHPGIAAREAAKRAGKGSKESNRAYCEAMRGLQNEFHRQVGLYYGHLREGPNRQRLSRGAYLAGQQEAERRGAMMAKVETDLSELESLRLAAVGAAQVKHRAKLLDDEVKALRERNAELTTEVAMLQRHRLIASQATRIATALIGMLVSGASHYRDSLLAAQRPVSIPDEVWIRLRRFLVGGGGGDVGRARKRRGEERY